jgi:signal recognition particle receptor subunit beta
MEGKTGTPPPARASKGATPTVDLDLTQPILIAIIIIIITLIYLKLRSRRSGRTILIVGPSESGKTAAFVQLTTEDESKVDTVTSTVPNEGEYLAGAKMTKPLILKDIPGHERVRGKYWEDNKSSLLGVIVFVDASAGNKGVREASEVLYSVLTDPLVNSVRPPILIFANKQDLPTAKGISVIKNLIEREIGTLRMTRSANLETTGGKSQASVKILGNMDKEFDFGQISGVEFGEGSSSDLSAIKAWLDKTG